MSSAIVLASVCAVAVGCTTATTVHDSAGVAPAPVMATGAPEPQPTRLATAADWMVPQDVPANAKAGECYTRAYVPRVFKEQDETVLRKAASERVEIVQAKYEDVEEQVLVKPAGKRIEVVPAEYETVEERVLIRPAGKRLEEVPAQFETVSEQVLVTPGYTAWKKGTGAPGAPTAVDATTGEVMCLVEVPPVYRTVTKEIVKSAPTVREVDVPAEYGMVKKQVLKRPAATREIEIPAEYRTVKVTKLVNREREVRTPIPAEYQTVKRTTITQEARLEWRSILCETNSTAVKIAEVQRALKAAGFDPGRVDGQVSDQTFSALGAYQRAKGLPLDTGRYINVATVRSLGVNP